MVHICCNSNISIKMRVTKLSFLVLTRFLILGGVVLLGFVQCVKCQDAGDYGKLDNPAALDFATQLIYSRISNLTAVLSGELNNRSSACIKDPSEDWNRAFNFSALAFLSKCIQRTNGDISRRICTAAEMKFYFKNLFETSVSSNYLKPNRNCNLTSWVSGCEPGWACSVGINQNVDLRDDKDIPSRTDDCQACCEGFFCPHGLACMIPCPLGSYCPQATLDNVTGVCVPYTYQLPPKDPNHTCGGANIWADVGRSREMFCSSGSYCPSTVEEIPCSSGQYCRMGSTSEIPCFKLASCNSNTTNQNIHAYGIMLIVALSTLLLIIHNCSDQIISTRTRRRAKSREAAVKSVRETTRARQRWKNAKEAAMKHARELRSRFSHTLSRRNLSASSGRFAMLDEDCCVENDIYPPHHPSNSSTSMPSEEDIRGPSIPMKEMHEIQEEPHQDEGFNHGSSGVKNKKKRDIPTAEDMHTPSQIFKYAYVQLEKEKEKEKNLEDKNLTFSGVISIATNTEIKKRPLIEVSFKDITLTLKGKNKHLLRSVTGVLKPGHITAVMGPSGAGKTSFLSALAGKAVGCSMTGTILINGKDVSVHSYKKITGFVPQDDIVHGNLTVEENLWFSANCRLPATMPKADKVLILERVIVSLGLQSVRDSLVGTVEERGISGGQRKRVNVGLEMVMEPSLLILDEPTSGLDSASSQLLLRALRHEALQGVNICMVVHQPSYTLFRMFDDLILLAKGGLVVYHGPAKQVEDYFAGLGIVVPERVNPPDHFIDVLEGIVTLSPSSGVSHKELPVRWMIHNHYPIPPDMRKDARSILSSTNPNTAAGLNAHGGMLDQSFAGELWQDVRSNMVMHRDKIRLNFLKSTDLSHRRTPGVLPQYKYYLGRIVKQRLRDSKVQAIDYIILLLAGACLGTLSKAGDENFGVPGYTYTIIAVSLLCKIAALRSFSLEKLQYWRESASGMSSFAYFLAKDTVDHFNTVIKPVVYLSMFYFFTNPRSSFAANYIVLLCLVYCVTGFGYALAIFFEPGAAQLWSVLLPVVLTLLATQSRGSDTIKMIANFCYPRWALEAFVISNAERYYGVWLITRCGALLKYGYDLRDWNICLTILILTGLAGRGMAFLGMLMFQKK